MPLNFPVSGGGDFKGLPSGSYAAICDQVVFLGLQPGNDLYPDPKYQVYIRWQVPSERVQFEKDNKKFEGPAVIGRTYTASMHKKAGVRIMLESWRGKTFTDDEAKNFDVSAILGQSCMLGVVEKESGGKIYSNISSIGRLPKGTAAPKAEGNLTYFSPENEGTYESLPKWIKEKLAAQIKPTAAPSVRRGPDEAARYDFGGEVPTEAYNNVHGLDASDADLPDNMQDDSSVPF
jgi:hypothetical protein